VLKFARRTALESSYKKYPRVIGAYFLSFEDEVHEPGEQYDVRVGHEDEANANCD